MPFESSGFHLCGKTGENFPANETVQSFSRRVCTSVIYDVHIVSLQIESDEK